MKKKLELSSPLPKTIHTITKMFNKNPSVELSVFSFQSGYMTTGVEEFSWSLMRQVSQNLNILSYFQTIKLSIGSSPVPYPVPSPVQISSPVFGYP